MSLWTVRDLAQFCGLHQNTIYKLIRKGEIPAIKRGRLIRFRKDEIDVWLNDHSSKVFPLLEPLTQIDLALDTYDKLFLCKKGGVKMNPKGKTWNYPFGSVYLRQSRWYFYFRFQGKRIRKVIEGALSRADALKVLQVEVADAFRGKHGFKKQERAIKFKDFADLYLENSKPHKRSWQKDKCRIEAHLKPTFGEMELKEITPLLVENYRTVRLKAGLKKSTTNRELALLKVIFSKAIDWDFCSENPVRKVKFFPENDNLKERILTPDEERRLLEHCADHLKPIILVALHTGMRRGEVLGLKWEQVDFRQGQIKVEKTKSGKTRFIPINSELLETLRELKKKDGKSEYLFVNPETGNPLKDVKTAFKAASRRAGILKFRFHDCRHTFATRLVESGVDLITVKELLGHSTVKVTERYTHSSRDSKREAVENLVKIHPQKGDRAQDFVPTMSTRNEMAFRNGLFSVN
jgi:excisionase family DNA binding protein